MSIASVVDSPREGDFCYRQRIPVQGWVHAGYRHERIRRISVHAPNGEIGSTSFLYPRADVAAAHGWPADTRTGFRLLAVYTPDGPPPPVVGIEVRVEFTDGTSTPLAGIHIQVLKNDHTGAPYGNLCNPRQTDVLALLLQGKPNKIIARELGVSVETVKDHVAAVLKALGVNSRTQAVLAVSQMVQRQPDQSFSTFRQPAH